MYILATKTEYLGKKLKNWNDVYYDENAVFIAQIIAKNVRIEQTNAIGMLISMVNCLFNFCKNIQYLLSFINSFSEPRRKESGCLSSI